MKSIIRKIYIDMMYASHIIYNFITLKQHHYSYKSFPKIGGKIYIRGRGKVILGKDIIINSSLKTNFYSGNYRSVIFCGENGKLSIANGTGISNSVIICEKKIDIGNNVKIGSGCLIYDTDCHSLNPVERRDYTRDNPQCKPIYIADDVFIGARSIILKGSKIGENSIIGAGSVVSGEIPKNEIWAGNPAKFIRKINL